jgi:hypothetical protein
MLHKTFTAINRYAKRTTQRATLMWNTLMLKGSAVYKIISRNIIPFNCVLYYHSEVI